MMDISLLTVNYIPCFPSGNDNFYLKGLKCPLNITDIKEHIINCEKILSSIEFL